MDADIDGTPFSVLMERAVSLKQAQTAHEREKYDAFPSFYANTIWPNEDAIKARKFEAFSEQLAAANLIKEEGNAAFRDKRLSDAKARYETALSVFRFLENTNPQWKSEGIKDQYVKELEYECKDEGEREKLNQFLVKCYTNIALVSYKMGDFSLAVKACDYALAVDQKGAKALVIRAQALLAPKNSGVAEQALARSDLKKAVKNNPDNQEARKLLRRLKIQVKAQRIKDRSTFKGMFNRGEIYDARELRDQKEARKKCAKEDEINARENDIDIGKQLVQIYEAQGLKQEKERLERSLNLAEKEKERLEESDVCKVSASCRNPSPTSHLDLDFRNPSTKMIQEAKDMGVDLKDPVTVELLEKMKAERIKEEMLTSGGRMSSGDNTLAPLVGNRMGRNGRQTYVYITILFVIAIAGYTISMIYGFRTNNENDENDLEFW